MNSQVGQLNLQMGIVSVGARRPVRQDCDSDAIGA